jgi:hypothetical protein
MSEYQFVAFRAIDAPVSEKNLKYMVKQSTRAEITTWSFENEYHFGDFRGNALEMLRRGYDIHLHYANFGIRRLLIRFPKGLPDLDAAKSYFDGESLQFNKDKRGPGGTLAVEPFYESGELEELWDLDELVDELVPIRKEIQAGDLRPLYLAHLAICCDCNHDPDEKMEGPVPAGLDKPTKAQLALTNFYGISPAMIAAAARGRDQSSDGADHRRTISQFRSEAEEIEKEAARRKAAADARARARLLAKMAEDPTPFLLKTEQLVVERSINAYGKASSLLADLREALSESDKSDLAEMQARKLHDAHPQFRGLIAALRRDGFIPKPAKRTARPRSQN